MIGPDSSWFWTMAQALAVAVSLYLIYRQLKAQRLANTLSTLKAMDERWNVGRLAAGRAMIAWTYPSADTKMDHQEEDVLTFFEEMAVYVRYGAFDIKSVWNLYSYYLEHYWPILKPKVTELRAAEQDDTYYEHAEWLYEKVCKYSKRRNANPRKTSQQLERFVKGEQTFAKALHLAGTSMASGKS